MPTTQQNGYMQAATPFYGGSAGVQSDRAAQMQTGYRQSLGNQYSAINAQEEEQRRQLQARQQQQLFANQLQGQAAGTSGPSAAQMLLQQGSDAAAQNAAALAAGTRGNPMLAQRQAQQAQQAIGGQAAQQAAMLRAQEQQQAQGLYGQMLGQIRGADMEGRGMYGQQGLGYGAQGIQGLGLQQGMDTAIMGAEGQTNALNVGAYGDAQSRELERQRIEMERQAAERQFWASIIGAGTGAVGTVLAAGAT
jgi:hypothetical protein